MFTPIYAADAASQSLKLADDLMSPVRKRLKTVTVRTGRRAITPGMLMLESTHGTEGACIVAVIQVSVTKLSEVPAWALAGERLSSTQELLDVLLKYYPNVTMDSEITSIAFGYIGEVVAAAA